MNPISLRNDIFNRLLNQGVSRLTLTLRPLALDPSELLYNKCNAASHFHRCSFLTPTFSKLSQFSAQTSFVALLISASLPFGANACAALSNLLHSDWPALRFAHSLVSSPSFSTCRYQTLPVADHLFLAELGVADAPCSFAALQLFNSTTQPSFPWSHKT
jgi:hypothetical protein